MVERFERFRAWISKCTVAMIFKLNHCPGGCAIGKEIIETQTACAVQVTADILKDISFGVSAVTDGGRCQPDCVGTTFE